MREDRGRGEGRDASMHTRLMIRLMIKYVTHHQSGHTETPQPHLQCVSGTDGASGLSRMGEVVSLMALLSLGVVFFSRLPGIVAMVAAVLRFQRNCVPRQGNLKLPQLLWDVVAVRLLDTVSQSTLL